MTLLPRFGLLARLTFSFGLLVALALAAGGFLALGEAEKMLAESDTSAKAVAEAEKALEEELAHRLVAIAGLTASSLYGDMIRSLPPTGGREPFLAKLERIRARTGVQDILVVDRQHRRLIDLAEPEQVGQEAMLLRLHSGPVAAAFAGETSTSDLYWVSGRAYKMGFAPILASDGEVVACVAVTLPTGYDEQVARLKERLTFTAERQRVASRLRDRFALIGLAGLAATLGLCVFLTQSILRPVQRLVAAMASVGPEGLPLKVEVPGQDELGFLSQRFNRMVDELGEKDLELRKLYEREKTRADIIEGYADFLLASVQSAVIGVDGQGRVVLWNEAVAAVLGLPAAASGTPAKELLPPAMAEMLTSSLEAAEEVTGEVDIRLRGVVRTVGVIASPVRDREGRPSGAAIIVTDISELRELQRRLQRTERLAALGELSAGLAHEIRNPLGALRGYSELLGRELAAHPARELTERIIGEIDILNRIVTDFLTFAGELNLTLEPIDLEKLIEQTQTLMAGDLPPTITIAREGRIQRPVVADALQLRKVLINVLQNAVVAMPAGGTVTVSLSEEAGRCRLDVSDEGGGIAPDIAERVFNPFFTTRPEGTGLGLAIAHRIIEAHAGEIGIVSRVGGGTTVRIQLPFGDTDG